jgi:hypothetical protein
LNRNNFQRHDVESFKKVQSWETSCLVAQNPSSSLLSSSLLFSLLIQKMAAVAAGAAPVVLPNQPGVFANATPQEVSELHAHYGQEWDRFPTQVKDALITMHRLNELPHKPMNQNLQSRKANPNTDQFWRDVFAGWMNVDNDKMLQYHLQQITTRGQSLLQRFNVLDYDELMQQPMYSVQGESIYSKVWKEYTGVMDDISSKAPALDTTGETTTTVQSLFKKGANFRLPLQFPSTAHGLATYQMKMDQAAKNSLKTWIQIIELTLVHHGLNQMEERQREQGKVMMGKSDFRNYTSYINGRAFAFNKDGTGWSGLETAVWGEMMGAGVRPTSVLTGVGSSRAIDLIQETSRMYYTAGPTMAQTVIVGDGGDVDAPFNLTAMGKSRHYKLDIDEGVPFNTAHSVRPIDPLQHSKFVSQFIVMSPPSGRSRAEDDYRTEDRSIRILDFATNKLQEITIQEAFHYCGIFHTDVRAKYTNLGQQLLQKLVSNKADAVNYLNTNTTMPSRIGYNAANRYALNGRPQDRLSKSIASEYAADEDFDDCDEDCDEETARDRRLNAWISQDNRPDSLFDLDVEDYNTEANDLGSSLRSQEREHELDKMGFGVNAYNLFLNQEILDKATKQFLRPDAQMALIEELANQRSSDAVQAQRDIIEHQSRLREPHALLNQMRDVPGGSAFSWLNEVPLNELSDDTRFAGTLPAQRPGRFHGSGRAGSGGVASTAAGASNSSTVTREFATLPGIAFPFYSDPQHATTFPFAQDKVINPAVSATKFKTHVKSIADAFRKSSALGLQALQRACSQCGNGILVLFGISAEEAGPGTDKLQTYFLYNVALQLALESIAENGSQLNDSAFSALQSIRALGKVGEPSYPSTELDQVVHNLVSSAKSADEASLAASRAAANAALGAIRAAADLLLTPSVGAASAAVLTADQARVLASVLLVSERNLQESLYKHHNGAIVGGSAKSPGAVATKVAQALIRLLVSGESPFSAIQRAYLVAFIRAVLYDGSDSEFKLAFDDTTTELVRDQDVSVELLKSIVKVSQAYASQNASFKATVESYVGRFRSQKRRAAGADGELPIGFKRRYQMIGTSNPRTIHRLLMRCRLTRSFFEMLFRENIHLPFSIILFRNAVEILSSSTIFYVKGDSTGFLVIKDASVMYGEYLHSQEIEVQIKFEAGLLIHRPSNIFFVPDTYAHKHIRGGGIEFFSVTDDIAAYQKSQVNRDIHAMIENRNFKPTATWLPISGLMDPRIYIDAENAKRRWYSTSEIYETAWQFFNPAEGRADEHMWSSTFFRDATPMHPYLSFLASHQVSDCNGGWVTVRGEDELGAVTFDGAASKLGGTDEFGGNGLVSSKPLVVPTPKA